MVFEPNNSGGNNSSSRMRLKNNSNGGKMMADQRLGEVSGVKLGKGLGLGIEGERNKRKNFEIDF